MHALDFWSFAVVVQPTLMLLAAVKRCSIQLLSILDEKLKLIRKTIADSRGKHQAFPAGGGVINPEGGQLPVG